MLALKSTRRRPGSCRRRRLPVGPEALEQRLVLSSSPGAASAVVAHTNYLEYHPAGSYPSWLTPGPQGVLPEDNGVVAPFSSSPAQIRAAYGVSGITFGTTAGDGTGQTIAIIDAYDDPSFVDSTASNFSSSDLAKFDQYYGLANPPSFTKYNEYGSTSGLPGTDPSGVGTNNWEVEEAIDVEWAHAIAPGASIDLIECNSSSYSDLFQGIAAAEAIPGVSVVSMSWGSSEFSGESSLDGAFTTPSGHQGITFVASTGDSGSPGEYPAYSPNVVAVGGTTIFLNPDNSYNTETAWSKGSDSWAPGAAGGGGISSYEAAPSFQSAVETITSFSGRATPDVSMEADPATGVAVYDSYNNGSSAPWIGGGGTSLAAPMWSALFAIADQGRAAEGGTTLNSSSNSRQALAALYSLPASAYHDLTTGNIGSYGAEPGFDEATGLGSPVANVLVPDLAAYGLGSRLAVTAQPPPEVYPGQPFDLQVSAEDSFGRVDTGFNGSVTLSGVALNGSPITVGAQAGVATFAGVSIGAGGYSLLATSGSASATTNVVATYPNYPVGYTPQQITSAYGIGGISFGGTTGDGTGQTIAIVDAGGDPFIASDLAAFDSEFGLPAANLTVLNESGGTSLPTPDPSGNWELEEDLDVEWAHSVAPGAKLVLIQCNLDSDLFTQILDLMTGVKTAAALSGVSVVSMSWGQVESQFAADAAEYGYLETSFDTVFTTPSGHQGVTFLAATGDHGSPSTGYPSYSPNVVAVGGTSLLQDSGGSWGQIGWGTAGSGGFNGTGGGVSENEPEPSYQEGVQSTGKRTTPDVSFEADLNTGVALYDYYSYYYGLGQSNPWTVVGGTSLAAPAWAGLVAIADQGRVSEGGLTLNSSTNAQQAQTALYSLPYGDYTDVTAGNNDGYNAGRGYDAVTGLGTPIASKLVPDLAAYGMASRLAVTQQPPANIVASDSFTLVVTAEDADGHVDSSYDGTVTITLPAGGGTATATAIDGVARFTNLYVFRASQDVTITAGATGLTSAVSAAFNVVPNVATQMTISTPSGVAAGTSFSVTVTAEDVDGNVATSYNGSVTIALSNNPGGGTLGGTLTVSASSGVAVFSGLTLTKVGSGYTITAGANGLGTTTTSGFNVVAGAAASLAVSGAPSTVTAGTAFTFQITAYDSYGNVATGYTGTMHFTSTDPAAVLPSNYTFTTANAGTHSFSATLKTSGAQTITAADTVSSGLKVNLNVTVSSGSSASASFLREDTTTAGNWSGVYGHDGTDIEGYTAALPSYATVSFSSNTQAVTWLTGTTDSRAPQNPASPSGTRVAAAWFNKTGSSFTIDVDLTDGQAHDLALYFLDWPNIGRQEKVQISDATSGTVLDTETVSSFSGGEYLQWKVSGNVVITITTVAGANSVLTGLFFDPTNASTGATATFLKSDTTTAGSWSGVYGHDGTDIEGYTAALPSYANVAFSSNTQAVTWSTSTTDSRAPQNPASPSGTRVAAAWFNKTGSSFTIDVDLTDGQAHDLALYFLDWPNIGRQEKVQISDATSGTVLDTETVSSFSGGEYLQWKVSGNVVITITTVAGANSVLTGLFFDPTNASTGATATFLKSDTTTLGSWSGVYGHDGTDIEGYTAALPSYATVSFSSNTQAVTWLTSTTDSRAPQNPASPSGTRVAAAWFNKTGSSFTIDVDLTDGQAHDLALYFLDWPNIGRQEKVQISDATSGTVLDTETVSSFSEGEYLQWKVSGNVVITITTVAGANSVLTGLFFDPTATGSGATATFLKSDTTTLGSWSGVYGHDGTDIEGYTAAVPSYATVSFSSNTQAVTWLTGTTDSRAPQNPASPSGTRVAAAWFNKTGSSFTIDVDLTDGQAHDLALYFLDWPNIGRQEKVQISDATSGTVLDTETVSSFSEGEYLQWKVSGNVVITITTVAGANSVLTGLFFDPATSGSSIFMASAHGGASGGASSAIAVGSIGTTPVGGGGADVSVHSPTVVAPIALGWGLSSSSGAPAVAVSMGVLPGPAQGPAADAGLPIHDLALDEVSIDGRRRFRGGLLD